jgi:hypothetical protein
MEKKKTKKVNEKKLNSKVRHKKKKNKKNSFKKKHIIFIVIVSFIILILFLGVRFNYLIQYNIKDNIDSSLKDIKVNDPITIQNKEAYKYINFNNLLIEDIYEDYECEEEKNLLVCKTEDKELSIEYQNSYREMFYTALLNYDNDDAYIKYFHKTYKEILDKKFENDYDFLIYILNRNLKSTFFTNVEDMRLNYYIKTIALKMFPEATKVTRFTGEINGFILSSNDAITVVVEDDEKNYILTFKNNYEDAIINTIKKNNV